MSLAFTMSRRSQLPAEQSSGFGAIAERFRRAGELERAVTLCQEGLQKFPDHLSARVTLGWAFLDLGKHDEARTELERVIRRAPDNLAAIRGLAALHDRMESADVEHMDAASTSWPPPSFAVPAVAPQVALAPESTPEVHYDTPAEPQASLEDLPLFQAAVQQEQEEAFHQQHAYEAPVEEAAEQEPFLPFDAAAAEPVQSEVPVQAPSIDDFDPVFPAAAESDEPEPVAAGFDEPIGPVAFEMPDERSASALESEFAVSITDEAAIAPEVVAAEPVHVTEPVDVPAPVQMAEPAPVVQPVQVAEAVQPVQVAEPVHIAEPAPIAAAPSPVAEPVQVAEPVKIAEPVHIVAEAAPVAAPATAAVAEEVPELLELEPLFMTVDDQPRPAGSITIEPVIDEPLTLDDAMPLTLDVEAIAVEDAATPLDAASTTRVVFPVRMQPAKPALVALEKLLRRVEDRKLAALAGSIAS